MPRKTKEQKGKELENKTTSTKKTNSKIPTTKTASKTTSSKKTAKVANSKTTSKTTGTKRATNNTTAKRSNNKKTTNKVAKKTVTKKVTKRVSKPLETVEYYDLPYRYNQTVVKLLAQTPTTLFIYWDISDKDRKTFEEQYGENFFNETRPVLIVHNDTLNYSFEVEINDFANSWYLHVADSKCDYRIELGRRPIIKKDKLEHTDYIYVTTSNELEAPNDRILFNKEQKMVYFRNVKTGATQEKQFASLSFMRNMGKIYNIYDLYKTIYKNENVEDIYDLTNPSSHPSS